MTSISTMRRVAARTTSVFVIGLTGLGLAGAPPAVAEVDPRSRTTAATQLLAQAQGELTAAAATQLPSTRRGS